MDGSRSPVQLTPPGTPEALLRHRLEIAHYKSELAAYTLRQWNIARLDAEKKETDRRRRKMHALAQYAAAGLTSPSSASAHSQAPPLLDGPAQYHHSAGGHILMTTRRESRRSFTTSATITPSSSHQHVHNYQPYHHAHHQHQPHPQPHPPYSQYAQHLQRFENAPSNSEHQRSYATNLHPANTPTATMSAQLDHARCVPTHALSDSNATSLSQSMSAMAIDPSYRHHTDHTNEHEARPPSSSHWQPSQHTPHLRRASTTSAGRAAGSHLGTQLLAMTPFHHSHGKSSSSAITSDEDSPVEGPSTEGSSRTSSSSLSGKPCTPRAQDALTPTFDSLGYRPNHRHRASMPMPQRKAKEERGAYMVGLNRNTTANLGGEGRGGADNARRGGGSRAVA